MQLAADTLVNWVVVQVGDEVQVVQHLDVVVQLVVQFCTQFQDLRVLTVCELCVHVSLLFYETKLT